ncbi:MAG: J domain-containing protein [Bacteriovorax sp.]|jgi:hypothetical protein
MLLNKDIIGRVIFSLIFFGMTFWVLGPVLMNFLKKKMPGQYTNETDLDTLIRRQKERLRSQYGLSGDVQGAQTKSRNKSNDDDDEDAKAIAPTSEMKQLYQETQWGGGQFLKELQKEISKNYSYTLADTKVNAFILLCEKRNYLRYLSEDNRKSKEAIKNYLVTLLIFFLMIDETKDKTFFVIEKIAKKINVTPYAMALAVQIKILMTTSLKNTLKEERIYSDILVLNQYSEDTIKAATEAISKKEANLWAKSPSQLFEELTLALSYSSMLMPIPKLKNRKDIDTASEILGIGTEASLEEIKKTYKKMALLKHPDKIVSQKLPKVLERKGIDRFNQIQEAYEVLVAHKK